jgi:ABC-2 type transport system ATP-binding protein
MKRRLDLALALVHRPRILFLDEPTTGLDPQSRSALWEEVARLAHDEGITVFLTTQYLEEADALADRVGIIDRGKIVAEGTPLQLKAEIGSPRVEVTPVDPEASDRLAELLGRFGGLRRNGRGSVTVELPGGEGQLAEIVRVLDQAHLKVELLQLHQPSLDDVFLAKTGRKLEGAGAGLTEVPEQPRSRRRRRRGG